MLTVQNLKLKSTPGQAGLILYEDEVNKILIVVGQKNYYY